MSGSDSPPWKLWYWPGIKGRGEYIRIIFEEAGVSYEEPGRQATEGFQAVMNFCFKGGNTNFPIRAPPAIQHGDFVLCNTPAIQAYLGRKFNLMPTDPEEAAHVESILAITTDAVAEGRLSFHPKDFYASHKGQEEASVPFIKQYGEQRLPKYFQFFESVLQKNKLSSSMLVGDKLSVADLSVYLFTCAAEQHFPDYYKTLIKDAPLLLALKTCIAERPRIKQYLTSDRCQPWDKDSMM